LRVISRRGGWNPASATPACRTIDLFDAHVADAAQFQGMLEEALSRYFVGRNGHYNPLGNHFCAFAMKDALVKLLDPKPPAYRS
jgi:hypothetical protein